MVEADFTEGSCHGATYFSCALPSPPPPPLPPPPPPPSEDSSCSTTVSSAINGSFSSAVIGVLYFDGGGLAENLGQNLCMLVARPGFLGAAVRIAVLVLCWVAGWVTPVCRILRGSRSMVMAITTIKSKGTVRLASGTDASARPLIDPAYFSHPEDRQVACEGWRTVRRAIRETETGKAVFGTEILPGKMCVLCFSGNK